MEHNKTNQFNGFESQKDYEFVLDAIKEHTKGAHTVAVYNVTAAGDPEEGLEQTEIYLNGTKYIINSLYESRSIADLIWKELKTGGRPKLHNWDCGYDPSDDDSIIVLSDDGCCDTIYLPDDLSDAETVRRITKYIVAEELERCLHVSTIAEAYAGMMDDNDDIKATSVELVDDCYEVYVAYTDNGAALKVVDGDVVKYSPDGVLGL